MSDSDVQLFVPTHKLNMKKLLLFLFSLAIMGLPMTTLAAYQYYLPLTVTSSATVASGTQTNFPMLVSSTFSQFAYPGQHIKNLTTNASTGIQEPADLIFSSTTACTASTKLNFETESYTSSTGALIDWVNVPSIATNTVIYACYNDSSVTTDQSHPSLTWDANYKGVWHLAAPTGTLTAFDSTGVDNATITNTAAATSTAKIDGAANFLSTTSTIITPTGTTLNITAQPISISAWVNITGSGGGAAGRLVDHNPGYVVWLGNGNIPTFSPLNTANTVSGGTITTNSSTYLSIVYAANTVSFYKNGVFDTSTATSTALGSTTNGLSIGNRSDATRYVNGMVDEVRISNSARTPSWIATEYNNQNNPATFYAVGTETSITPTSDVTITDAVTIKDACTIR